MMGPVILLFLGLVAVFAVLQAACLFVVWRQGSRAARTLDQVAEQLGRPLAPLHQDVSRAARNFAEVTDLATLQARRGDGLLAEVADAVRSTKRFLEHVVLPIGAYLGTLTAAFRLARSVSRLFGRPR